MATRSLFLPVSFIIFAMLAGCRPKADENNSSTHGDSTSTQPYKDVLSKSLTFHVSFDQSGDADVGGGDRKIYTGDLKGQREQAPLAGEVGLGNPGLDIAIGMGRHGGALQFTKEKTHAVFYKLERNIAYADKNFNGTASCWMRLDPQEIPDKYCDPLGITDKYYASDAIWVDITKNDVPPDMRLGVLGDERVWDVSKRQGAAEEFFWHLAKISEPPFQKNKWTHVVITWELNGADIGRAKLYLDGELRGRSGPIREPFLWDVTNVTMRLGTGSYVGMMDDIALFNKALNPEEVIVLFELKNGVRELYP